MSRFHLSQALSSDEPEVSSHDSGNTGEMPPPGSPGHPMTLSQCLFVVGLLVLALVFSYLVVFRIDPFAVDLHRSTSPSLSLAADSVGDRP